MGFKKISIWISGPQIVLYQIRQKIFNLKSTLVKLHTLNTAGVCGEGVNPQIKTKTFFLMPIFKNFQ